MGLRLQLRKQQAEAGDIVLLYGDESEALTHPYLARAWAKLSSPSASNAKSPLSAPWLVALELAIVGAIGHHSLPSRIFQ